MNSLNDIISRSERLIDLAKSLMVYSSLMDETKRGELDVIMAGNAVILSEIVDEAKAYMPSQEERKQCASCHL